MTKRTFASFIRWCRQQRNMTQVQYAKAIGISRSYLARIERGDYRPLDLSLGMHIRLQRGLPRTEQQWFDYFIK